MKIPLKHFLAFFENTRTVKLNFPRGLFEQIQEKQTRRKTKIDGAVESIRQRINKEREQGKRAEGS